jgi:DNA-binding SARP family transcriptional activator
MHALLREHCLERLARDEPGRLAGLRERASIALARRGELDEATLLALDAGAWAQARQLIEEQAEQLSGRGAWSTLAGWLARLPRDLVREGPVLALLEVRVEIRLMRLPEAHTLLDQLDLTSLAPGEQAQASLYRAIAYRQARRLDDARRAHRNARALIEEHEPAGSLLRVEADLEEGITLGMAGDLAPSVQLLERAAAGAESRGSARLAAEAHQNLGLALQFAGQLGAAQLAMREARRRWEHLGERELRLLTLNNEATTTQALGDLDAAALAYQEIRQQAEVLGIRRLDALGALGLADIARDRADLESAAVLYDEALVVAREIGHAGVEAAAAFGKAMGLRERGALPEARSLLEHHRQITQEQGTSEFASLFRIGLAGVLLSEARPTEALTTLAEVLEGPAGGYQRRQLALLMRAVAEFRLLWTDEAQATLIELQALVEELGYDQFIVAEARLCPDLLLDERVATLPGGYFPVLLERARRSEANAAAEPLPEPVDFVVRAFGVPAVTRPGDPAPDLHWRSAQSSQLFFFLLARGRAVTREEIADALWPEASPSRLASLFHSSLHRLRRAMGDRAVIHERGTYGLDPTLRLDYDVRTFEERLAEADGATSDEERARALEPALALYRGEYARPIDAPWADAIRVRLARRYLVARLALAKYALTSGRYDDAVTHAEAALEAEPASEEALRHLIAAHVGAGHTDLALLAYRQLNDLLEGELGPIPSADTLRALERSRSEVRPGV